MQIHIHAQDGIPIYQQIVNQIKYQLASARLKPGQELPPIRTLAESLLINPNTVARAYKELEQAGIVEKRRTVGTYITARRSPLARRERRRILVERIDQLLAEARQLDFDLRDVIRLLNVRHKVLRKPNRKEAGQ
ncbi:MAG: hypothetical protein RLZZ232_3567 [Planctomycetota bacterium]